MAKDQVEKAMKWRKNETQQCVIIRYKYSKMMINLSHEHFLNTKAHASPLEDESVFSCWAIFRSLWVRNRPPGPRVSFFACWWRLSCMYDDFSSSHCRFRACAKCASRIWRACWSSQMDLSAFDQERCSTFTVNPSSHTLNFVDRRYDIKIWNCFGTMIRNDIETRCIYPIRPQSSGPSNDAVSLCIWFITSMTCSTIDLLTCHAFTSPFAKEFPFISDEDDDPPSQVARHNSQRINHTINMSEQQTFDDETSPYQGLQIADELWVIVHSERRFGSDRQMTFLYSLGTIQLWISWREGCLLSGTDGKDSTPLFWISDSLGKAWLLI